MDMASPSASVSATPTATANGQMMNGNNMMARPSASASASPSATPTASATATASNMDTAKAPRTTAKAPQTHHGAGGDSASAADSDRLPSTGGVPWVPLVSVGALVLLMGFGLAAYRLLRRSA